MWIRGRSGGTGQAQACLLLLQSYCLDASKNLNICSLSPESLLLAYTFYINAKIEFRLIPTISFGMIMIFNYTCIGG